MTIEVLRNLPILASIPITILISLCSIGAVGYLIIKLPKILKNNNDATNKQNNLLRDINSNMVLQKQSLDNNTKVIETYVNSQKIMEERLNNVSKDTRYLRENVATKDDISMMLHFKES